MMSCSRGDCRCCCSCLSGIREVHEIYANGDLPQFCSVCHLELPSPEALASHYLQAHDGKLIFASDQLLRYIIGLPERPSLWS